MPTCSDPLAPGLLALRLAEAHRTGAVVDAPAVPADIAAAMACQRSVAARLGEAVAGWKVATGPDGGAVAAPLLGSLFCDSPAVFPHRAGLTIEIELAVRLGRDLPPDRARDRVAVLDAIEAVFVGVELVRPRLAAGAPFTAFLADNLGNAGYVAGRRLLRAMPDLAGLCARARLDGAILCERPCAHPAGDPLAPLVAYAAAQNDRLGGLRAGQVVTTGSLCGLIAVARPGRLVAEVDGLDAVEIEVRPAP